MSDELDVVESGDGDSFEQSEADYKAEILEAQGLIGESEEDEQPDDGTGGDLPDDEGGEAEPVLPVKDGGNTESAEGEDRADQGADEAETDKETTPQKGFVRLEALHAEREHRQYIQKENTALKDQIGQLQGEMDSLRNQTLASVQLGFKKLSPEELKQLAYDDPEAVPTYLENEKKYSQTLKDLSEHQKAPHETDEFRREVDFAYTSLGARIPGILDQGSEAQKAFYDSFAKAELDDAFSPLLDPATVLITADGKTVPLGERAISVINLINKVGSPDPETAREQLEKEITEKVTKELVAKFKKPSQKSSSLADINSVDRDGPGVPEPTEAQKMMFSEDQWDRYTAGDDWRNK